ncbi:MAG: hypothetical protein QNJ22_23965 [Desulfosarcinaceae bacterium]|nr:hypothetical protein [Desulfosarcinaceae bacterium]
MKYGLLLLALLSMGGLSDASAGEADVQNVEITKGVGDTYTVDVTVAHADTGWDHYADKWDLLDEAGNLLGTRVLYHPHVDEQPFTRRLSGVKIPADVQTIEVRAHDSVHQYGGRTYRIAVPK